MPLKLYFHPLASYCWKVLVALYENDTPFEPHIVGDGASHETFEKLWPIAKFPLLRDDDRDETVPESSIIIEYLARHHPGRVALVPADADLARATRLRDRFYDLYVHLPMQKIVGDRRRPPGQKDPYGVEQARTLLATAYRMIDRQAGDATWAMGETFTLADCAAAPALFYANKVLPLGREHASTAAYLNRLLERPSFARTVAEAQPYFGLFPQEESAPAR